MPVWAGGCRCQVAGGWRGRLPFLWHDSDSSAPFRDSGLSLERCGGQG